MHNIITMVYINNKRVTGESILAYFDSFSIEWIMNSAFKSAHLGQLSSDDGFWKHEPHILYRSILNMCRMAEVSTKLDALEKEADGEAAKAGQTNILDGSTANIYRRI